MPTPAPVHTVHRVAEARELPLRGRNVLLETAGLAPGYPEMPVSDGAAVPFHNAVRMLLTSHEPYLAYVVNRWWEMVAANTAGRQFFGLSGDGPVSVVDLVLGPGPIHDMIGNFPAVGWMFLRRMRREVAESEPNERLQEVLERADNYMKDVPDDAEASGSELVVCPHFRIGDKLIKTVVMVARFVTAREVNLDELRVELAFPRDDEAEAFFRQGAQLSRTRSLPGSGNPCRLADTQPERSPRCTPSCLFAKVP